MTTAGQRSLVAVISLVSALALGACAAGESGEPSADGVITVAEEATVASEEASDGNLALGEPFEISALEDNDVFLTINDITVGEECRFGMHTPDDPTDHMGAESVYLQVLADVEVKKLDNPLSQGYVYLNDPKILDSDGYTREADLGFDCQSGENYEDWLMPTAQGEKTRRYGTFIIPRDTKEIRIYDKTFEIVP